MGSLLVVSLKVVSLEVWPWLTRIFSFRQNHIDRVVYEYHHYMAEVLDMCDDGNEGVPGGFADALNRLCELEEKLIRLRLYPQQVRRYSLSEPLRRLRYPRGPHSRAVAKRYARAMRDHIKREGGPWAVGLK